MQYLTIQKNIKLTSLEYKNFYSNLIYWPIFLGYQQTNSTKLWLQKGFLQKQYKKVLPFWKSEFLIQFFSRNVYIVVHTPSVYNLVHKVHLLSSDSLKNWSKVNASTLVFGFSTGRCGFKPNETKGFVAADTLIRAGLWFIKRFHKKLSPLKVRYMGPRHKMMKYIRRLQPLYKKNLSYKYTSFLDSTPVAFDNQGCNLKRTPRKRYRYSEYSLYKVSKYIQKRYMAQKTPLPAKTVMYADRWNATWFSDLANFKNKLMEDYTLRFLILGYLRKKRYWLYLFSINNSGGFFFFQMAILNSRAKLKLPAFISRTPISQSYLQHYQKQTKRYLLTGDTTITFGPGTFNFDLWTKRMNELQVSKLNYLHSFALDNVLSLFRNDVPATRRLNLSQYLGATLNYKRQALTTERLFSEMAKERTLSLFCVPFLTLLKQYKQPSFNKKLILSYCHKLAKNMQPTLSLMLKYPVFFMPSKLIVNSKYRHKVQKVKEFKPYKPGFKKQSNKSGLQHRFYSKLSLVVKPRGKPLRQPLNNMAALIWGHFKKKRTVHQTVSHLRDYFFKNAFAFKNFSSIKAGLQFFLNKKLKKARYLPSVKVIISPLIFLMQGLKRVTGSRIFVSYMPLQWDHKYYKPLKKFLVFEKFGYKKYFVPTMVALHLAMSRGSAILLVDLLVRKLRHTTNHQQFLACVEKICRYFMTARQVSVAYPNSLTKGIEILFVGKLNGSDRSKVWRFKFGPLHTSTFYTNTREEHAKCMTRYGVFNIRVRMKLGLLLPKDTTLLINSDRRKTDHQELASKYSYLSTLPIDRHSRNSVAKRRYFSTCCCI